LGRWATEGRSTATTLLSLGTVRSLQAAEDLKPAARKLLSFTDNRQDASLQRATSRLRGDRRAALRSLSAARAAGSEGISYDNLTQAVFNTLDLPFAEYASNPEAILLPQQNTSRH